MFDSITNWFDDHPKLGVPATVLIVLVCAMVASRLARFVIRRVIRRLAKRSLVLPIGAPSRWRERRTAGEGADVEHRRRQRIDAASRMVSHLASVAIWIIATIVLFNVLELNPTFYLSSAGFLGAAIAIGGQHKVNDYLTGLSVHFEDRYGVGDEIEVVTPQGATVQAVVDHVGLFSTRLRDARSTLHYPNAALDSVRNLSQEAAVSTIRLHVAADQSADDAAELLRGLAGTDGLTDVIFVGDLDAHTPTTGEVELEVRTARSLNEASKSRLVRRAESILDPER